MKRLSVLIAVITALVMALSVCGCASGENGGNEEYSLYIRYSHYADGQSFTAEFEDGMEYVGFAMAKEAPSDKTKYTWLNKNELGCSKDCGNIYIKYSASANGANATSTWSQGQEYLGVATSNIEPQNDSEYTWVKFMQQTAQPTSIKILAIGNSFSDDAVEYLWHIYKDAGYETVIVANLYIGGCTLDTHWNNIQNNSPAYLYRKNTAGSFVETANTTLQTGLLDEDWDIITLQQASGSSGKAETYTQLGNLINYVNQNKTNPNAKLYWHATWAYQQNSTHDDFAKYDGKQLNMYNSIISTVKSEIASNANFAGIIPSGTTIQNLRTSPLGDTITRDGYHANFHVGRYSLGLTWYAKLSGEDVSKINYIPTTVNIEDGNKIATSMSVIKESVKNAIDNPYEITNCENTLGALNYWVMGAEDKQHLQAAGLNPDDYLKVNLEWTVGGYYNANDGENPSTPHVSDANNFHLKWACTRKFDKEDLPVGTVIYVQQGFCYRPEGWVAHNAAVKTRADAVNADTDAKTFTVTADWVKEFNFRAFNLSFISQTNDMQAVDCNALSIFIPKASINI